MNSKDKTIDDLIRLLDIQNTIQRNYVREQLKGVDTDCLRLMRIHTQNLYDWARS